jgi:hypothetical protein
MNRPRRPPFPPARKKNNTPARRGPATGGPGGSRRRSPLDLVPTNIEPRFRVLGTGTDRNALMTFATPMEMLVIHGFTSEIEREFSEFNGRADDFWTKKPELMDQARKIDELLAAIVARKGAPRQN